MPAVFFDFDGTLFDTRADLVAAVNHMRRDLSLAELPQEAVLANVGLGARYLLGHSIPERSVDEIWEPFCARYAEHCCEQAVPYPGVVRTLAELRDRGWKLGINTSKPRFAVEAILAKFGLARHFGAAIVAGGDGIALKPDPASLRECASRLGGHRLSSRDWMVGDSWTDLQCAANAGVKGAWCTFGFGQPGDARYAARLSRFEELLRYLKPED